MTPDEIMQAYEVVAQDVRNRTAQDAAMIGNSQRSLGTLAERVASPSGQTSGLANYTYNRLLRPTVDTATTALITQGKAQALQTDLTNKLLAAKQSYEDAKNNYTVASTAANNNNNNNNQLYSEKTDTRNNVEKAPAAGTILGAQFIFGSGYDVKIADGNGGVITKNFPNATNPVEAIQMYRNGNTAANNTATGTSMSQNNIQNTLGDWQMPISRTSFK